MFKFEKLGAFYLGRRQDVDSGETTDETVLYDARDLTTHALCVGMTGSGKTGLCISLLEEAAIDGIPALVIDPKGDMGNMLLTFPELRSADFEPWVDRDAALRKGLEPQEYAEQVAALWKEGLASWGEDGDRIRRLRAAADFAIYTPGSNAGLPLTVLRSFDAPSRELRDDEEAFTERIHGAVAGLLGLVGIGADPVKSREAILLANIFDRAWREGRGLGLEDLIRAIQSPPFDRLGVIELESFYPAKERTELAMTLNGLLASPSFARWMEGEPLDVSKLLYTDKGKPRIAILSIAHLSESERMFFVTILLNEVVSWMRTQTGTSSLRALLYMDEIFGYFPPSREPASKRPMLTLLKQARAYGLGVVLATQNPVDLDYKGLANTGTWLIGRLQTERDKARVLDGLEGAMTGGGKSFDRRRMDALLSSLGKRVFLMNNVHDDEPVVFHTRWAMSYLCGPLSREQVKTLMDPVRASAAPGASPEGPAAVSTASVPAGTQEPERPVLPSEVREYFLPRRGELGGEERLVYRPALGAEARLHYANARAKVDEWVELAIRAPLSEEDGVDWEAGSVQVDRNELDYRSKPEEPAAFATLPAVAARAKSYPAWQKSLKSHLYQNHALTLWKNKELKLMSRPDEAERDFRSRLVLAAHEKRDLEVARLRKRYAPKLARLEERIRKARERIGREEEQYSEKKTGSLISLGSTLLGAFLGRKKVSVTNVRRAGSTARSFAGASKEKADIERARRDLEAEQEKLADLQAEFEEALTELQEPTRPDELELDEVVIRPRKSDIEASRPALLWMPWRVDEDGIAERAF